MGWASATTQSISDTQIRAAITKATITQKLNQQTPAELAAGVTPDTDYEGHPTVDIRRYGGVADGGVTNNTPALQAAYDSLPARGGRIYFPGEDDYYGFTGPVDLSTRAIAVTLVGDNMRTSELKYTGSNATPFLTSANPELVLKDLAIEGDGLAATQVGISTAQKVWATRCRFSHWGTAFDWTAGFYHRFENCDFNRCDRFFDGWNANNTQFVNCLFFGFDTLIACSGGQGPITFTNCSIEWWFNSVVLSEAGAVFNANLFGCYLEGGAPSDTEIYTNQVGAATYADGDQDIIRSSGDGSLVVLLGNLLSLKGTRRIVNQAGETDSHVVSRNFLYSVGTNLRADTLYVLGANPRGEIVDQLQGSVGNAYVSAAIGNRDLTLYDPATDTWLSKEGVGVVRRGTFTGTLTGCTTSPTAEIAYERQGDFVTLYVPDLTATSNSNACTITGAPSVLHPPTNRRTVGLTVDDGVTGIGAIDVLTNGALRLAVGSNPTGFTASGTKGIEDQAITYGVGSNA